MSHRGDVGRAARDAEPARTVNISSQLVLMHGARHGFRDSGARLASTQQPATTTSTITTTTGICIITEPISPKRL